MPRAPRPVEGDGSPGLREARDRALLPMLEALAQEVEARAASGELANDIKGKRLTQIIFMLEKLAATFKGPAVQMNLNLPAPPNQEILRVNSALRQTPHARAIAHARAVKMITGQIVPKPITPKGKRRPPPENA